MAQVTITQLPNASALTGAESVPIVQNGVTVQTTTGAIAGAGALNYPFLTVSQTAGLTQSRYLSTNGGLTLTDNGAQGTLQVNLIGAAMSLNSSGTGIQVKTGANTVTAREIEVGAGLGITNGDGVSGNPTVALGTFLQQLVSLTGTGILALQSGTAAKINILGTTSQTSITNGDGSGDVTVALANNAIMPGLGSLTLPQGATGDRVNRIGAIRYNTTTEVFEGYTNTGWNPFSLAGGVTSFSAGTTGFTPSTDTTGAVTLDGILNGAHGGTGVNNGTNTITIGGNFEVSGVFDLEFVVTAATALNLPTTGTLATLAGVETLTNKTMSGGSNTFTNIPNSALTNDSVTYNGVTVALGASGTITATATNALTIGTGLLGTSYNGSAPVTISIDSTVATLTGSQTLTNKSMSGSSNTFTNIPNSALTNSSVTIGTTNIALGATSLTLGGLTSVTVTTGPVADLDLATKQYVDTMVATGISFHTAVKYEVPLINLNATYNNGTAGVGATLTNAGTLVAFTPDGTVASAGDRILVYNQTNPAENGVYTVTTVGSGSVAWVLTRATDADTYGNGPTALDQGSTFFITSGATGAGESYTCTTVGTITFGTTAITFAQISDTQIYSAGTGLTLSGTQFSITNTGVTAATYGSASKTVTLAINAQGQITSASEQDISIAASQVTSGTLAVARGGTNIGSYTTGDMMYASGATALSVLGIGSSTYIMTSSGTAPQWSDPTGITVGTATNAVNTGITANSTNADYYLTFVSATTGNLPQLVNSSVTVNPSTGKLTGGIAGGAF